MKVKDLMERKVRSCLVGDSINWAAQLMWEGDCGALPVVGQDGSVVGMITDRDICMAAYTKGRPLTALKVEDAMARQVTSCSTDSSIETAMSLMKEARVRRLPIVNAQGMLTGILSLNDLAREARRQSKFGRKEIERADVADTMGVLCEHRSLMPTESKSRALPSGRVVGSGV